MRNTWALPVVLLIIVMGLNNSVQAAKKSPSVSGGLSNNLAVSGQTIYSDAPDPKLPGHFLFKIWAGGFNSQSVAGTSILRVTAVTVYLFQRGKAAARLNAPRADADTASQSVRATGRVHVFSLTEKGTTLDADTVIWHARTNIIDATGNVVYHNGKNGVTLHGPHFIANTVLQTLSSVGPGQATFH